MNICISNSLDDSFSFTFRYKGELYLNEDNFNFKTTYICDNVREQGRRGNFNFKIILREIGMLIGFFDAPLIIA